MKIGILTYHCVPNFGAQLQVISTVGYLKRKGHEPIVLHWYPSDLEAMYRKRVPHAQYEQHYKFAEDTLPLTNLCRTEEQLVTEINTHGLEGLVVGSDALFKYIPHKKRKRFSLSKMRYKVTEVMSVEDIAGNPFFCDFYDTLEHKIPVCAFSVSSQNCRYQATNRKEKAYFKHNLSHFANISVRDEWTKDMVCYFTGYKDIEITPDPVFSFNENCYINLPSQKQLQARYDLPENYVLLGFSRNFIPPEYAEAIAKELHTQGFFPIELPMPEGESVLNHISRIQQPIPPTDWYALIRHAQGYIGERMHPIVVCLHNSTPFFAFDEYGVRTRKSFHLNRTYLPQSSKTYHILQQAGFLNNLHSYRSKAILPHVETIVNQIKNFDKQKCTLFARQQQESYTQSMDTVLNILENHDCQTNL